MPILKDQRRSDSAPLAGNAALIASVGGQRGYADWTNPHHRFRRLLSEFIGMAGLTFILSGGAAIPARYGGHALQPWQKALVLSAVAALWLVVAVYFLGDISAHFDPAVTLAFALRRDMGWAMAGAYWLVQFIAAACGSLLARGLFGPGGNLAATMPRPGMSWQAAGFEAIITFGLVLMTLNLADGPKLNGPFVPLAVGAYIMAWATMGGPFDGASMNPARSFGPDLALGNLEHLVGVPDRARGRRRPRRRCGVRAARAGQGRRSQRRAGNTSGPGCLKPRGTVLLRWLRKYGAAARGSYDRRTTAASCHASAGALTRRMCGDARPADAGLRHPQGTW